MTKKILFFADRLPPLIGGVEMHARYFIEHFTQHPRFPLASIITKNIEGADCLVQKEGLLPIDMDNLSQWMQPDIVFFNSGRWIEEMVRIKDLFPQATFFYRTGGNEIVKASLVHQKISDHALRQSYWAKTINHVVDVLITNSAYTESRLRKVGITCPFKRCVGGVNTAALKPVRSPPQGSPILFSAARFVPYKKHSLLLSVIGNLFARGLKFKLRLAGDGPLLAEAKKRIEQEKLSSVVRFLGALDNEKICQEIAQANIYIQLSANYLTEVPGGSYIHAEGMGRSILEALSAGTFILAARTGALPEIVTRDRGLLVDLDNVEHITDQAEKVIKNLPDRLPFSDRYSWAKMFNKYENLFDNENITRHRKMLAKQA